MIYFDSAYIAKCYLPEPGHAEVLSLAESDGDVVSSLLARAEVAAVFHRKLREKDLAPAAMREVRAQFDSDCRSGLWRFLPIGVESIIAVAAAYARLPANLFLRSADCIHLVAARMAGCGAIYSSDRHVLAAAARFGLDGIDVVPSAR